MDQLPFFPWEYPFFEYERDLDAPNLHRALKAKIIAYVLTPCFDYSHTR